MQLLRSVGRHPLALLGVLGIAFLGWICWDLFPAGPINPKLPAGAEHAANPLLAPMQNGVTDTVVPDPLPPGAPPELSKLKPGMPRSEVEELLGTPSAEAVSPASVAGGRVTYIVSYEADRGPMPTIRPIGAPAHAGSRPEPNGRMLVLLVFDATKPGHPLVGVRIPPMAS
jgi:hypothetical protein